MAVPRHHTINFSRTIDKCQTNCHAVKKRITSWNKYFIFYNLLKIISITAIYLQYISIVFYNS